MPTPSEVPGLWSCPGSDDRNSKAQGGRRQLGSGHYFSQGYLRSALDEVKGRLVPQCGRGATNLRGNQGSELMKFFRWLGKELREVFPVTLFFFLGFILVSLIVKLMLEEYDIPVKIFSQSMVAALIIGKVVLVLEQVRLEDRFPNSPKGVLVTIKTAFYGFWAIVVGFLERIVEAWRATGGFASGLHEAWMHTEIHRFSAVILCVTILFATYFTFLEVEKKMGRGAIVALLFKRPQNARRAT